MDCLILPRNVIIGRHHYVWFMRYQVVNAGFLIVFFIILGIMPAKDVIYIRRILCVLWRGQKVGVDLLFGLCRSGVVQCCRSVLCLGNSTHILWPVCFSGGRKLLVATLMTLFWARSPEKNMQQVQLRWKALYIWCRWY